MASNEQTQAIVSGVRKAFEAFKHHETFTRRVKPYIEKALPGYTVDVDPNYIGALCKISVWGKGLSHSEGVQITWNNSSYSERPWTERLAEALEIYDRSDTIERERDEEALLGRLAELEATVVAARAEAAAMFKALPVPASATIRKESHFWDSPSHTTSERFPHLFKRLAK